MEMIKLVILTIWASFAFNVANSQDSVFTSRSLQASQLDRIELMANPPARYEAAGNAGVINFKTKKNKVKGLNGNMAASLGKSRVWRTNESLSINYRTGNLNLFANTGYSIPH